MLDSRFQEINAELKKEDEAHPIYVSDIQVNTRCTDESSVEVQVFAYFYKTEHNDLDATTDRDIIPAFNDLLG